MVYVPSSFLGKVLHQCGLDAHLIKTVKLGLPHVDLLKRTACARSRIGSDTTVVFGYRGAASYHKGMYFLFRVIRELPEDVKNGCRFIFRGPDTTASLPNVLIYPPYSPKDLPKYCDEYDIGILPHLWFENSPVTLLEHLAAGKPVVTARLGGVEDYISEGLNGWLFEAGNVHALTSTICGIVNNFPLLPEVDKTIVNTAADFLESLPP